MATKKDRLTVEIDKVLATEYRAAYFRVFGRHSRDHTSLARFMAAFVTDRLYEEIRFLEKEEGNEVK